MNAPTAMAVPRQARAVRDEWRQLAAATVEPATFDPAALTGMPEPARRWLTHAISPGTPLWQTTQLSMRGQIRLGRWRPFTGHQVITPPRGRIWAATAGLAGIPVTGFDRLSSGTGQMRWRLLGLVPVMTAAGPDTTRSAYGRLAGEIALIPTVSSSAPASQPRRSDEAGPSSETPWKRWFQAASPATVQVWVVPHAGHTVAWRPRPGPGRPT